MYAYRQIMTRLRQGDSDLEITRSSTIGRKNIAHIRVLASARGRLASDTALPDDSILASALVRKESLRKNRIYTLDPRRAKICSWYAAGVRGTSGHATLGRSGRH